MLYIFAVHFQMQPFQVLIFLSYFFCLSTQPLVSISVQYEDQLFCVVSCVIHHSQHQVCIILVHVAVFLFVD